jgi:hypothetical protein
MAVPQARDYRNFTWAGEIFPGAEGKLVPGIANSVAHFIPTCRM